MPYRIPLRADIFWPCANPKFVIILASIWIKMVRNTGIKINVAPRAIRDIVLTNMQHFEHGRQRRRLSSRISAEFILQSGHNVRHTKQRGLVMSLVGPLAVWVSYSQTLSPQHPNTLQPCVSKKGNGRLAHPCPVPDIHQAPTCSPLHLPYASLHCQTRARGQDTDRYAPARQSIPRD